jgi:hypothetical protein
MRELVIHTIQAEMLLSHLNLIVTQIQLHLMKQLALGIAQMLHTQSS